MCGDKFSISLSQRRILTLCFVIRTRKMDILQHLFVFIVLILYLCKDVTPLTITASRSDEKALYGTNPFTISSVYTLVGSEQLYFVTLSRKREGDTDFNNLITFQSPGSSLNTTYTTAGNALKDRTVATGPTTVSTTSSLQFTEIKCDDKAVYKWLASYSDGNPQSATATVEIVVKAKTIFKEKVEPVFTPSSDLKAGDEVTFTCEGDVGNEPVGTLAWFYYLDGNTVGGTDLSSEAPVTAPVWQSSNCSYRRTSTLKLTLTRAMNQMVMRCTCQQDIVNENGDKHRQTKEITVHYPPVLNPIVSSAGSFNFTEGGDPVTLTCSAESNPLPTFYWIRHALDNSTQDTIIQGNTVTVVNITQENSGRKFTCVASNIIGGQNYTVDSMAQIFVSEQTTTPIPTTVTTESSTADTTGVTNKPGPSTSKAGADTTTIIIIVVVVVVVLIIALAIFFVFWKKRSKKNPEIEEPPDKPRNNRDLTFSSNRPDLVSSEQGIKNNALNSSFNSFDSTDKPPREDGLMYIDLQFEDKPRSRRPIQLLDNGSPGGGTPYADIAMPRV